LGLTNVGKSTLFNAITVAGAEAVNYPFLYNRSQYRGCCGPDVRVDVLARMYQPSKVAASVIEFVDIAGLVKGTSEGEGLSSQFLSQIREVDAIVYVVRCFDDSRVVHVDGSLNPRRDIEVVEAELIFKDLDAIEKRRVDSLKRGKTGDKKIRKPISMRECATICSPDVLPVLQAVRTMMSATRCEISTC
jgi:ribosome-binding ATPase YchF (GTP1/OBG family)